MKIEAAVERDGGAAAEAKLRGAAEQFEALMLTELLRAAHSEGGWFGSGEDAASSQESAMAEQFLAQALASKGGLGIAKMVNNSMAAKSTGVSPPPADL